MFCMPTEKNLSARRRAEIALIDIVRNEMVKQILLESNVLICDEIGMHFCLLSC